MCSDRSGRLWARLTLLAGVLPLHDVRDTEAFCRSVITSSRLKLSRDDYDDCLAFLISTAWELSLRYDPGDSPPRFSTYARNLLARRLIDWQRKRFGRTKWQRAGGRTYERERVKLISLDAHDSERDPLVESLAARSVDDHEHRLADELRALADRGRPSDRKEEDLDAAAA